jgi:hypothetical protein
LPAAQDEDVGATADQHKQGAFDLTASRATGLEARASLKRP